MNRRAFLSGRFASGSRTGSSFSPQERSLTTGLEAYSGPWDAVHASHLLRRTMMMPKWSEISTLLSKTSSEAVDLLLSTPSTPTAPTVATHDTESTDGLDAVLVAQLRGVWASDWGALQTWWANVMVDSPLSIVEKMTFFWSGHFTTQFNLDSTDYVQAPLLYLQNSMFRQVGLGNFQDMVFDVTLNGAMLVFLGGDLNYKGRPNENYARELMELYTMGLGHYSEGDVREAARILTGWHIARYNDKPAPNGLFVPYFTPLHHDQGAKQFLGHSFPAIADAENTEDLVRKGEITKLIDVIFQERADEIAKFICTKIYHFFVYSNPGGGDLKVIDEMATLFKTSDFDIKIVIEKLLKSAHFFDNANIGAQVKTPAEFVIGLARQLGYKTNMASTMTSMLQSIFQPPNVSGWTGWHDWITTNTFPVRSAASAAAIAGMNDQLTGTFITQFPNNNDAHKLIDAVGALMLPRPLSKARHDDLVNRLVAGGKDYEWPTILSDSPATAARNMRDVLTAITTLPDFQLC